MIPVIVAEVLDELAHDIPHLPGASCRGRAELFDVADRHDPAVERAKAVCASCPALRDCRAWLAGLPRLARPCGVVAGRYVAPPKLRPAYEPRPRTPSSRDRVTDWLRAYLAARGPVLSTQVIGDAAAAGIGISTLRKARIDLNVRLQRVSVSVPVTRGFDAAASTNLVCGRRSVRSPVRRSTGAGSRLGEERSRQDTAPRYICLGRHPRRQAIRGPAGNYGVGCTADVRLAAWRPTTRP